MTAADTLVAGARPRPASASASASGDGAADATGAAPRRASRIAYQPALDGLRGVALLLMLTYHGGVSWFPGSYLSVSTFFTLSGFLITALLLIEQHSAADGRIDLRRFWSKRVRRLLPAALAGIALAIVAAAVAGTPSQLVRLRWDVTSALLYFANLRFMTSGHSYWEIFSRPSPLQHFWSLAIEEQFYLLYPLLLIGITTIARRRRSHLRLVLVALALASAATMIVLSWVGVAPARLYYGTDTRAAEFLAGAVLATVLVRDGQIVPWHGRGARVATGLAAIYVVALLYLVGPDAPFVYRGGFALYAIATALLINAALQPGLVRRVLSARPLVWLGVISYGAYVYHWPIDQLLDAHRTGLDGAALLAAQLAATFVVARLSYVALEKPIRTGRWPNGRARLLAPAAAVALIALATVLVSADPGGVADREAHGSWAPPPMPDVSSPRRAHAVRVIVFGDSVAWTLGRGFASWAEKTGDEIAVWNLAVYGCGLARSYDGAPVYQLLSERKCDDWTGWWEAEIDRFRPDVVVILSGSWDLVERRLPGSTALRSPGDPVYDDWLLGEYQLAVDIASSRGAHVVWLTAPCLGPEAAQSPLGRTAAIEPANIERLDRVILPRLAASRPGRVTLFDLFATVCPDGRFVDRLPWADDLRPDGIHFGKHAARRIASRLVETTWPLLGLTIPGAGDGDRLAPDAARVPEATQPDPP